MIPPVIVTIYGNVSVGKSPFADEMARLAEAKGKTVFVNDHRLFAFSERFDSDLQKAKKRIQDGGYDFGVIVVGTGTGAKPPFRLEVEHQGFGALPLYDLLFSRGID